MRTLVHRSWSIRGGRVLVSGASYAVCVCGVTPGISPDHAEKLLRQEAWSEPTEVELHRHMMHAHSSMSAHFRSDDADNPVRKEVAVPVENAVDYISPQAEPPVEQNVPVDTGRGNDNGQ